MVERVDRLAGLFVDQHLTERLATRAAAGMRRQDSIRARVDPDPPRKRWWCKRSRSAVDCVVRRSGLYPIPTPLSSGITSTPRRLRTAEAVGSGRAYSCESAAPWPVAGTTAPS